MSQSTRESLSALMQSSVTIDFYHRDGLKVATTMARHGGKNQLLRNFALRKNVSLRVLIEGASA